MQVALRPKLAKAFRLIARMERRELSDIFKEMLAMWIRVHHPHKYSKVDLDDEE